jgi:hypothetical protein
VAKSTVKQPGKVAAKSHRSAAFFGAMGAGMVGRAAMWAPGKLGWTGPKAEGKNVAFGEDRPEMEEEPDHQPTVEELDEMIREHQRRFGVDKDVATDEDVAADESGEASDEESDEGAVNF